MDKSSIVAIHTDPYTHQNVEGTAEVVEVLHVDAKGVYRCRVRFIAFPSSDGWIMSEDRTVYERLIVLCDSPESLCNCIRRH